METNYNCITYRVSRAIRYVVALAAFSAIHSIALAQPHLPVLLARANNSKVMLLIDDSGSMAAGMIHHDFDVNDPLNANTAYRIPMFIFRVNSGSSAPLLTNRFQPLLLPIQRGYQDNQNTTSGSLWDSTITLSSYSTHKAISNLKKNSTTSGVNTLRKFGLPTNPAVTGGTIFTVGQLYQYLGVNVTDTAGNEFILADADCTAGTTTVDAMCGVAYDQDYNHTFVRFDASGNLLSNMRQRFYSTQGGEIRFQGKKIPLGPGFYEEKYIRWLFYFATQDQLDALPQETRIEASKRIVRDLINNNTSIQFGVATFNGNNYSTNNTNVNLLESLKHPQGNGSSGVYPVIRAPIGSDKATLLAAVANIGPLSGTPPHAAFVEVMRYFDSRNNNKNTYYGKQVRSGSDYTTPITSDCDNHYVVLLTDGIPLSDCRNRFDAGSGEANIPNTDGIADPAYPSSTCHQDWSEYLDDASMLAHNYDFSTLPGTQSLTSFAVGLGLRFDLLDRFANYGGSGTAYKVETVEELSDAFDEIITTLVTTPVSGAGVALAESLGNDTRVFRPTFYQKTWRGTLDVFQLQDDQLVYQYDMGETLENRDLTAEPRVIYAGSDTDADGVTDTMVDFTTANAAVLKNQLFSRFLGSSPEDVTDLADPIEDITQDSSAATLISYINGNSIDDMRSRDYDNDGHTEKLGDIIYSRPIEIGPVNGTFHTLDGYTDWTASLRNQPSLVVVGANDGMIHAFDAANGTELWSYIPANLLPKLEYLSRMDYNLGWHQYFVDGLMLAQDAFVNGEWRTLLIFGQREGGTAYTVLDVTDRTHPTLLLEVSDPTDIGESWSMPTVVKSGGSTASTSGSAFTWWLAVGSGEARAATGTKLIFYKLQSGPPVKTTVNLETTSAIGTRTTSILWVNDDKDLNDDRGYVGTEDGDLFRIAVIGTTTSAWVVDKIYDGDANYPIVATPAAVLAENPQYVLGGTGQASLPYSVMVSFGTGHYDIHDDIAWYQTRPQRIIGLFDPVNPSDDSLVNMLYTTTTTSMQKQNNGSYANRFTTDKKFMLPLGKKGFYVDLGTTVSVATSNFIEPVGMVIHPPLVARGALVYSTFLPNTDACGVGGNSFLEAVDFRTGGGVVIDGLAEQPINPRYSGGIQDFNSSGSITSADVSYGLSQGMIEMVLDAKVSSVDLSDTERPYRHDGLLDENDIRLNSSNGGIIPSVSALGNSGAPSPPVLSYVGEMVIVQNAFVVEPEFGSAGETEPTGTQYNETPPSTQQFNLYTIPPKLLSFHEVMEN